MSVLLRKSRVHSEIYNDLDRGVVNLFRVLRDPVAAAELQQLLSLTPFAREEFEASYAEDNVAPIEWARRFVVRSFMGFGSDSCNKARATGFRANARNAGTSTGADWSHYPDNLPAIVDRLRGVIIENRPAIEVMRFFDGPSTLFYVDPPYVMSMRSNSPGVYSHEMTGNDHYELGIFLLGLSGMVVLSGYRNKLYDEIFAQWERHDHLTKTNGGQHRVESLWLNAAAAHNGQGQFL
jgi:DNA adenine methylase